MRYLIINTGPQPCAFSFSLENRFSAPATTSGSVGLRRYLWCTWCTVARMEVWMLRRAEGIGGSGIEDGNESTSSWSLAGGSE